MLKFIRGDKYTTYHRTFPNDLHNAEIKLEFDESTDLIDFGVVNARNITGLTAKATFQSENGSSENSTFEYKISEKSGVERIPLHFDVPEEAINATISFDIGECRSTSISHRILNKFITVDTPRVETPAIKSSTEKKNPIIIFSIEALRHDHLHLFEPVFEVFDGDASVPDEPRIQGNWTPTSHASLFTGAYPGEHRYLPSLTTQEQTDRIDPKYESLGRVLGSEQYKCSANVATDRVTPEHGFCQGFSQFVRNNMRSPSWPARDGDARSKVNRTIRWIDEDVELGWNSLFYFIQTSDTHHPYVPPFSYRDDIDFSHAEALRPDNAPDGHEYLSWLENGIDVESDHIAYIKEDYRESVRYTAQQIARLLRHLKTKELYEQSFILIVGDHGQEFLERNFRTHGSLNDAAIRPGMILKPPNESDWEVPDSVDFIDILPTIATELGVPVPDTCQGVPLQTKNSQYFRISERFSPNTYNISVERDDIKGIFTYETTTRPNQAELADGPIHTEYYSLNAVRNGNYEDIRDELSTSQQSELFEAVEQFLSDGTLPNQK
jgi:hypothetical protein